MSVRTLIGLLAAGGLVLTACGKKEFTQSFTTKGRLDKDGNEVPNSGQTYTAAQLNDGREAYMLYCYGCHGEKGDGLGPSSAFMRPPPRNFQLALFKFPGTAFGQLPVDSALDRTIRRGLHGTPMLAWDIPVREREAIIAYLKVLSPRWKEEGVPPELEIAPDPWTGKKDEAIALGKKVYHVASGGAGCNGCHASYESRAEIDRMTQEETGEGVAEFAEEMYRTSLKETEYLADLLAQERLRGCTVSLKLAKWEPNEETLVVLVDGKDVAKDEKEGWTFDKEKVRLAFHGPSCDGLKKNPDASLFVGKRYAQLPPDFLFHKVKTAYPVGTLINEGEYATGNKYVTYSEQMQREDLYRTIGVGIGGAAMPGWKGVLPEEKLWALVYYVQDIVERNGTAQGWATRKALDEQPAWQPAPSPAPAPAPAEGK